MKTYSIKNFSGQKMLIVNDIKSVNVLDLFKLSISMNIPFAVKNEIGVQIWGAFIVSEYLGLKDSSKLLS
jgi:hypothetical protein